MKGRSTQVGLLTKLPGQTALDLKEKGQPGRGMAGLAPVCPHVSYHLAQSSGCKKESRPCRGAKLVLFGGGLLG